MEGIYTWIRSLAGYFLFVTVLEQLLPGKKYGKYVRLFSGMVLILLVVQPLTDKAKIEEAIARDYEKLLFQYEAGDLKEEILGIEQERLDQIIRQYEEAVAGDIRLMAEDGGVRVQDCQVSICADQEDGRFGTVTAVRLSVYPDARGQEAEVPEKRPEDGGTAAAGINPVQPVEIDISGNRKSKESGTDRNTGEGNTSDSMIQDEAQDKSNPADSNGEMEMQDQEAAAVGSVGLAPVPGLRRKIAAYYNLEEAYVEIQIVERKR